MPDSPNGTYTLPPSYKVANGDTADASQHNPPFEDLAQAVSDRLHRDGRTSWTGNQNANGFKITGLANGTNPGDAVSVGQIGPIIGNAAPKTTPVDGDFVAISDSEDSKKLKGVKWEDFKSIIASMISSAAGDPWALQPIGVPVPLLDNLAGVAAPATNKAYRYIKLTAGDAYNAGVLTDESVSGADPLVTATAKITLAGSPVNGRTVHLINTERRFVRAGSAGTVQNDAFQGHRHQMGGQANVQGGSGSAVFARDANAGGGSTTYTTDARTVSGAGDVRADTETRPKNIGVTYFMRVL